MVLRSIFILLVICSTFPLLAVNQLFFTDSYETNLYKSNEAVITFNNNLFSVIDSTMQDGVDSIFKAFFKEVNLKAKKINSNKKYQIAYAYQTRSEAFLSWSKIWHSSYERRLNNYLQKNIKTYIKQAENSSASAIAFNKLLYFYSIKHSSSLNAFGNTRINIQIPEINTVFFSQNHISPNQTWNRVITNSKLSSFNEAFYVDTLKADYLFLGPNSKSRLTDCISLHLLESLSTTPVKARYLSNYTYFTLQEKDRLSIDSNDIAKLIPKVFQQILANINSPDFAFYSYEDLQSIERIKESYSLATFYEFIDLFIYTNNFTALIDRKSKAPIYSYYMIKDTIFYKENVEFLKSENDSALLNQVASFLLNNSFREFQIFGNASKTEYLKIEKSKYKSLVEKYNTYSPIKVSKTIDLSLYRALVIFDYLYHQGVSPHKMLCIGKKHTPTEGKRFAKTYFILKH